jgi:hypothetical protein
VDRRVTTLTTDDVISIVAVGAFFVAVVVCAVARYLGASA